MLTLVLTTRKYQQPEISSRLTRIYFNSSSSNVIVSILQLRNFKYSSVETTQLLIHDRTADPRDSGIFVREVEKSVKCQHKKKNQQKATVAALGPPRGGVSAGNRPEIEPLTSALRTRSHQAGKPTQTE